MKKGLDESYTQFPQKDHDLLTVISSQLIDLRREVKELKDGTLSKIANLEREKADRKVVEELQEKVNNDVENRLRRLEDSDSKQSGEKLGIGISWNVVVIVIGFVITIFGIVYGLKHF